MIIGLDYNNTFTADRDLWADFVRAALKRGHEVSIVTFRTAGVSMLGDNADIEKDAKNLGIPIVYTGGDAKYLHFNADIWIDDIPWCEGSAAEVIKF